MTLCQTGGGGISEIAKRRRPRPAEAARHLSLAEMGDAPKQMPGQWRRTMGAKAAT
jgi:hypothetical protein